MLALRTSMPPPRYRAGARSAQGVAWSHTPRCLCMSETLLTVRGSRSGVPVDLARTAAAVVMSMDAGDIRCGRPRRVPRPEVPHRLPRSLLVTPR